MFDLQSIRRDFPILSRQVKGRPLVYLDNAATSQKPQAVINALVDYYQNHNANVHRGIHTLSDESTQMYQEARATIARFIGAQKPDELIFTKNTTESINLVAFSWAQTHLKPGDEIIVTELEHHSNLVPWQRVCQQTGAKLLFLPIDGNGDLAVEYLQTLVGERTKLVALTHVSNVLGTIIDIYHLTKTIKQANPQVKILVDGAQSVPHLPVNVSELNLDFLAFSSHKMCGPMGVGCLYVRHSVLTTLDPFLLGGGMINKVTKTQSTWADLPDKFDAGTPNVEGVVGLAAACNYLKSIGMTEIRNHEKLLTDYSLTRFIDLERQGVIELYGLRDLAKRAGIITFNIIGAHAHDAAQIMDREFGIAVRSGHHCNQPLMDKLYVPATVRASFYLYNTTAEIDLLIKAIHRVREIFTP